MFRRKIYDKLVEWKEKSKGETALLIEGARRVGKTTISEYFGKNNFPSFVTIDFSKEDSTTLNIFNKIPSADKMDNFFRDLFLSVGKSIPPKDSLIIFDEIQFCPKARQAIKHLVLDKRYYYIETGSLISIKDNTKNILIPSEEKSIEMLPMDFEEFLLATSEDYILPSIKEIFDTNNYELEQKYHHEFMKQFKLYLAIGGMPQAVNKYIETKDLLEVHNVKMDIINLYNKDLEKIDNKYGTICKRMWNLMPSFLTNHNTKFITSKLNVKKDSLLLQKSIETIKDSKIVNYLPLCYEPKFGMKLTESPQEFKLYYSDTGLFSALIFEEEKEAKNSIYKKLVFSKLDANLGMLYENVICQILKASGYIPYFYKWKEEIDNKIKHFEIDFMITKNAKILPIEVKKSKNFTADSLTLFSNKYRIEKGIILSPKALKNEQKIKYIPLYMSYLV